MHRTPSFRVVLSIVFGMSVGAAHAQFGGPAATPAQPATTTTPAKPAPSAKPATPAKPAASPARPAAPAVEPPYDVASKLYEQGKQKEALVILQQLAEAGDARAQYLVGLDLLEAVYLPRDNAKGLAYLLLAGEDTQWGDLIAPRAREARALVEPQLSGAELVRADAIVGEYRAKHAQKKP